MSDACHNFIGRDMSDFGKPTFGEDGDSCGWSLSKLRTYFDYCKRIDPELGAAAKTILSAYYVHQRYVLEDLHGNGNY